MSTENELKIRLFQIKDYETVFDLWIQSGLKMTLSDKEDELLKFANANKDSFFILEKNKKIIGAIIASYDGRRGYINHLAILPEEQNKGYGKMLLQKAMDFYKSINTVKVHLMVEKDNASVVDYYEKLGWVVRDDLVLMSYTLRES